MPSISASVVAAGIGAAGSIGGSLIGANAAGQAAKQQANAATNALNFQKQVYGQTQQNLSPYMQGGNAALSQLLSLYGLGPGGNGTPNATAAWGALTNFPGYQFGLDQGVQALDRSAASRGMLLSGAQLKDAQSFGTNYALSQAWTPYVTQLGSLASLGENAAVGAGNLGQQGANNYGNLQLALGQAQASGTMGSANYLMGGLNGAIQNGLFGYAMQNNGGYGSNYSPEMNFTGPAGASQTNGVYASQPYDFVSQMWPGT